MRKTFLQFKSGPDEGLENKHINSQIEIKGDENGILHIKFYALAFGNVDSWGDVIMPNACDEFLKGEDADRMALCWQHDRSIVIGKITDKGVDTYGMWVEADILPTTVGKDAAILLKSGAVKEFSIGYRATKYHYERREGYDYEIRILDAITVIECSPVTRAANAKAILTDAKHDNPNIKNKPIMTPEEIKAMQQSIEQAKAENTRLAEELKLTKDSLAKAEEQRKSVEDGLKTAKETVEAQGKSIDNLDTTVKNQQKQIEDLLEQKKEKAMSVKQFIAAFCEEHKEEMMEKMAKENGRFKIETKQINDITRALIDPNNSLSLQKDNDISARKRARRTFIELLGVSPRTADKLSWIEGTVQDDVDYVDENGSNENKGDASIAEVQRGYGKLQTKLIITTEVTDWYPVFADWAQNEAYDALLEKFNSEIWAGAGADTSSSTKKKIYGIKTHATAWDALADHILDENANYADAIFNACEQISNAGYTPDVAVVSPVVYFKLRSLKDKQGNYILDRQTDVLVSDSRTVRVIKAQELTNNEFVVMDLSCCKPYAGNSFEFEGVRDPEYDRWKFFFRLCGQNKIKTDWKKGLVYCDDADDAVEALAPEVVEEEEESGNGSGSGAQQPGS